MKRGTQAIIGAGALLTAAALVLFWAMPEWRELMVFLLAASVFLLLGGLISMRQEVYRPLDELEEVVSAWPETTPTDLRGRMGRIEGDVGRIAAAMLRQMEGAQNKISELRGQVSRETEMRVRRELAEEISRTALPHVLPEYPSRENFEVAGLVEPGKLPACTFYDYFYIDPGLLCVVIGQTPGQGVEEALFMVVAQTAIRSRLRQGLSLAETLADVNRQLYDLGGKRSIGALVGTLNTADGRLSYVNAGQQKPLLMRNEGRYEWLDTPVYAQLGLNENVSYRMMEIQLKQGDRLFLHTAGLGDMTNRNGVPFREQEMRAVLNRSRGESRSPEEMLRFVADEATVYCDSDAETQGYAELVLEYRKGTRELAHCEVSAMPENAPQVEAFLKQRFRENGIQPRYYARAAVLVDELFALCCRHCAPDSLVNTECGIAPDGQSVTIRMSMATSGRNPLETGGDEPGGNAVEFIRSQADYVAFKEGPERDTVTMVCFLE